MRFFNYLWLIEILVNTGLLRSANKIRLAQLILKVLALISIAAGFLHLVSKDCVRTSSVRKPLTFMTYHRLKTWATLGWMICTTDSKSCSGNVSCMYTGE